MGGSRSPSTAGRWSRPWSAAATSHGVCCAGKRLYSVRSTGASVLPGACTPYTRCWPAPDSTEALTHDTCPVPMQATRRRPVLHRDALRRPLRRRRRVLLPTSQCSLTAHFALRTAPYLLGTVRASCAPAPRTRPSSCSSAATTRRRWPQQRGWCAARVAVVPSRRPAQSLDRKHRPTFVSEYQPR